MRLPVLVLGLMALAVPSFGATVPNRELLKACQDASEASQNFCYGFIIAAANGAQFYRNIADAQDAYLDICLPPEVSNQEVVDIYIQWCQNHPQMMDGPAFIGVSTSFSTKYSCKTENH